MLPMADVPSDALTHLSDALAARVAAAAPLVAAIRVGPNRHISGIVWQPDLIVTSDQLLPPHDVCTVVLPGGALTAARPARRDSAANIAALRLDGSASGTAAITPGEARLGTVALAFGADAEARPTVRLAVVHRMVQPATHERAALLDIAAHVVEQGGPVLDAAGRLLGMAVAALNDQVMVVPHATIARMLDPVRGLVDGRRGWLGAALQPISVPEAMRQVAGQSSGRMVISLAPSGPAELAGLRPGDILLSLDGHSVSGPHALRALLGPERIGRQVEIRLVRDGQVQSRPLVVAPQPPA
jgi:S1-C subfamily serine protease